MAQEKYIARYIHEFEDEPYCVVKYVYSQGKLVIGGRRRFRETIANFIINTLNPDIIPEPTMHQGMNIRYSFNCTLTEFDEYIDQLKSVNGIQFETLNSINRLM